MNWYCFRAKHKREKVACRNLERTVGVETYSPTVSYLRATRRGRVRFTEAMFVGYVFVHTNLEESLQTILRTAGVVDAVRYGQLVPPVARGFVETLRDALGGDHYEYPDITDSVPYAMVRVVGGPFAGLIGRVVSSNSATERVCIIVELLGRSVDIEVSAGDAVPEVEIGRGVSI